MSGQPIFSKISFAEFLSKNLLIVKCCESNAALVGSTPIVLQPFFLKKFNKRPSLQPISSTVFSF